MRGMDKNSGNERLWHPFVYQLDNALDLIKVLFTHILFPLSILSAVDNITDVNPDHVTRWVIVGIIAWIAWFRFEIPNLRQRNLDRTEKYKKSLSSDKWYYKFPAPVFSLTVAIAALGAVSPAALFEVVPFV